MQNLICFSHLRWDFVYQRPQHLLSRFGKKFQVFYFEEAVHAEEDYYEFYQDRGVTIVKQFANLEASDYVERLRMLVNEVIKDFQIENFGIWYYTPMALQYSDHLAAEIVIYDVMDELSAFKFADSKLPALDEQLFTKADVIFTGGNSLFEAKKHRHHNIHEFPSSIDRQHFSQARENLTEPHDQKNIPHPRLGFFGVVDERFDIDLLKNSALIKPQFQFVIIGPVVKIDFEELPKLPNIHYLGGRKYDDLPSYISHWDVALILFARNESTKFISPTKTPEYLAAGLPVISTPIQDVVNPYGVNNLVHIVETAEELVEAAEKKLSNNQNDQWLKKVDGFLAGNSWDSTFENMLQQIELALAKNKLYV